VHKNREARIAKREKKALKAQRQLEEMEQSAYYGAGDPDEDLDDEEYDEDDEPRRRGLHPIFVVLIAVAVIVGAMFYAQKYFENMLEPLDPEDTTIVRVVIPDGATTAQIAGILKERELISDKRFSTEIFRLHSRMEGYDGQYKQGEYELTRAMSVDDMIKTIIKGNVAKTVRFTVPEGLTSEQIRDVLIDAGIMSGAEFDEEVLHGEFDYSFLEGCPEGEGRLEGFLYPETYEVYADASAHDVIDKMLAQFDALFKDEYYQRAQELGLSVREVVTVASLIERETRVEAERKVIAGVIYNRLEDGWKLQIDATIQYILDEPKEFLLNSDLEIDSPYNTYLYEGLPPGPICCPRMASVEAALYPDDHAYYF